MCVLKFILYEYQNTVTEHFLLQHEHRCCTSLYIDLMFMWCTQHQSILCITIFVLAAVRGAVWSRHLCEWPCKTRFRHLSAAKQSLGQSWRGFLPSISSSSKEVFLLGAARAEIDKNRALKAEHRYVRVIAFR